MLCPLHKNVGRIFFLYFEMSRFVWISWLRFDTKRVFFLFRQYLPVVLSYWSEVIFLWSFLSIYVLVLFALPCSFACYCSFFICPSSLISYPDFEFLFGFLREISTLSLTRFAAAFHLLFQFFLICPSSLTLHPDFEFLFGFLWEISTLSLTRFAAAFRLLL